MKNVHTLPRLPARPITFEKTFVDCPLMWQEHGKAGGTMWWAGSINGMVEISYQSDLGPWVSDIWVAAHRPAGPRKGEESSLIRIDPNDRDLFGLIADSVLFAHQGDINEWVDRELAHREAA